MKERETLRYRLRGPNPDMDGDISMTDSKLTAEPNNSAGDITSWRTRRLFNACSPESGAHPVPPDTTREPAPLKLSICISTFNRADRIGATLESIITQVTGDCEIVVLDAASPDNTERVVAKYARRCGHLRYVRQDTNNGIDRDFDHVLELAHGEYCWFMSDDDLLKPGAVVAVLEAIREDWSLVFVNWERRDSSMSTIVQESEFNIEANSVYGPAEMDRLFDEMNSYLAYIGCVVIKRAIWLTRERKRYYGSLLVHIGVIFQERLPGKALVMAEPFISVRCGTSHTWWSHLFELAMITWPSLVQSLALSESTKRKACSPGAWGYFKRLLALRALDAYSLTEYRRWILPRAHSMRATLIPILVLLLPGVLLNTICFIYWSALARPNSIRLELKRSRFYLGNLLAPRRTSKASTQVEQLSSLRTIASRRRLRRVGRQ